MGKNSGTTQDAAAQLQQKSQPRYDSSNEKVDVDLEKQTSTDTNEVEEITESTMKPELV